MFISIRPSKLIIVSIVVVVFIGIVTYWINGSNSIFTVLQKNSTNNQELIKDSHKVIDLNQQGLKLHLVLDTSANLHFYMVRDKEVLTTDLIVNIQDPTLYGEDRDVYWTAYEHPGKYFIFAGLITNSKIHYLDVNDLKENIKYFEYQNHKFFYSITKMETPYRIKGYSLENNLIYKNYQ